MADPIDTSTLGPIRVEQPGATDAWLESYMIANPGGILWRGKRLFTASDMIAAFRAGARSITAATPPTGESK